MNHKRMFVIYVSFIITYILLNVKWISETYKQIPYQFVSARNWTGLRRTTGKDQQEQKPDVSFISSTSVNVYNESGGKSTFMPSTEVLRNSTMAEVETNSHGLQRYIQNRSILEIIPYYIFKQKPIRFIPSLKNPCFFTSKDSANKTNK